MPKSQAPRGLSKRELIKEHLVRDRDFNAEAVLRSDSYRDAKSASTVTRGKYSK